MTGANLLNRDFRFCMGVVFWTLLVGAVAAHGVRAQPSSCGSGFVETTGQAAILIDAATARDRAIVDARANAAETCGVQVESRSIVNMGMLLDQFAQVKAFAFVRAHEVLSEWQKNGIYYVKIKAWVKAGQEAEAAKKELLSNRLILILPGGKGAELIEEVLKEKLTGAGFAIIDRELVRSRVGPATWDCLKAGNPTCVGESFYPFLTNYIVRVTSKVTPSQNHHGLLSFRAKADISCVQVTTAILRPYTRKRDIIWGRDENQAINGGSINQFEAKIALPLAGNFLEQLSTEFGQKERKVRITISGLPNQDAFERSKFLVQSLRWVKGISAESFAGGSGRLDAGYTEKSIYLAAMIAFRSEYEVARFAWDRIDVNYRGNGRP